MRAARIASPRVLAVVCAALLLTFAVASSRSEGATTVRVKVGGEFLGSPLAKGGVVWYNGYDPGSIVVSTGDTVLWDAVGGVHTVTSSATVAGGLFVFDSSPIFTPDAALADMGPGKLLPPGATFDVDTGTLAVGRYTIFCKIHPGMSGSLDVASTGPPTLLLNAVAGWGDSLYAVQAFSPQNLTVTRGAIVRWTLMNPTEPHTITGTAAGGAEAFDSSPDFNPPGPPPVMLPGQSFSWTFTTPGSFVYFCKVHAYKIGTSWVGMVGVVHVLAPPTAVDPSGNFAVFGYGAFALAAVALLAALYGIGRRRGPAEPPPPPP